MIKICILALAVLGYARAEDCDEDHFTHDAEGEIGGSTGGNGGNGQVRAKFAASPATL